MRAAPLLFLAILLAGCGSPTPPAIPLPIEAPAPAPRYDMNVRVLEETPDGAPIAFAEVVAYELGPDGRVGRAVPSVTTMDGTARFSFTEPVRLALRASRAGWTQEGTVVEVGDMLTAEPGVVASDRDVFLPLYRTELRFAQALTLSTSMVGPDGMGNLARPVTTTDLALPDRAQAGYLARLASATVVLSWTEGVGQHADLAAGLAWDGTPWAEGPSTSPVPAPGSRSATFDGDLPADGWPEDLAAASLQAAAITSTAVVGDVPVAFDVALRFSGQVPTGLPAPCHAADSSVGCLPLPPL